MIVSHKYRYVFIELPLTGSLAIARELRLNYSGERVLAKHAHYGEFQRWAKGPELEYFRFSGVRNPLELVYSEFVKYKTDHRGRFSGKRYEKHGRMRKYVTRYREESRYQFILKKDAHFGTDLRRFYRLPYSSWSTLWHDRLDYVYRFENLATEFDAILRKIGVEPVRALPSWNTTAGTGAGPLAALAERRDKIHAKWVFQPYMKRWGYDMPPDWDDIPDQRWNHACYSVAHGFRSLYWRYLR